MLANTINVNSMYFKEFEGIQGRIKETEEGRTYHITTEKGTRVYIEIIELKQSTIKRR